MGLMGYLSGSLHRLARRPKPTGKNSSSVRPAVETLEDRSLLSAAPATLTVGDVRLLLHRASDASASTDAIIAVVDRNGTPLGVRVEAGVAANIQDNTSLRVFAIDGALAEARTAAYFANDQAPLTSRTVQFISQSTITLREVNSNPNIANVFSTLRGPGYVAPVGLGGHFPPRVANTPPVDLFGIEHTNRDSLIHPNALGVKVKGTKPLPSRFNVPTKFIPPGKMLTAPESYGFVTRLKPLAQARGIGTLPGGIPIYKNGTLVGGIGVFFPGKTGFATAENSSLSSTYDPNKLDRSLEAEYIAFAAAGGSSGAGFKFGAIGDAPALPPSFDIPYGRIDLAGITLDLIGPGGLNGPNVLAQFGSTLGVGSNSGKDVPVAPANKYLPGKPVPEGWLVIPHTGVGITAAQVRQMILQGIVTAANTRAQIRTPAGQRTAMVFAVADKQGNVLGLYRMHDATYFSIDVAVAKARNASYYADPTALQPLDRVPGLPPGVAITARTIRYLAQPRYPEGIDGTAPGPFSILNDRGQEAIDFQSVYGHDSFAPETNFHDRRDPIDNQSGIVFFPGSSAVFVMRGGQLVLGGGLGVSGDGVDEDDLVTTGSITGFDAPANLRADAFFVLGARLPYSKFSRNPLA